MTQVKFFHSAMTGAPVLSGTAGALIAVLDACLKDGFGVKNVDSLVVAANVATVNVTGGHIFEGGTVVLVAGATPAGLNGEKRVLSSTAGYVTFAAPGIADQTATGTITAKLAPLGWNKPHTGTNLAAYKPSDVSATGCLLRVDDTGTTSARVVGYETMSDVNTGQGAFPTAAQVLGGAFWDKAVSAGATARPWWIFGDHRAVYLCVSIGSVTTQAIIYYFGDIVPTRTADPYACVLGAGTTAQGVSSPSSVQIACLGVSYRAAGPSYIARAGNALGTAQQCFHVGLNHISASDAQYSACPQYALMTYPNVSDNSLLFGKVAAIQGSGLRGTFPGLYHVPQSAVDSFATRDQVAGTGDLAGRTLMAQRAGAPSSTSVNVYGLCFFDVTGPWR